MTSAKSPLKDRKGRARPQESAEGSPLGKTSHQLETKTKGRISRAAKSLPLNVEIPTTPLLDNFLGPFDFAAINQVRKATAHKAMKRSHS